MTTFTSFETLASSESKLLDLLEQATSVVKMNISTLQTNCAESSDKTSTKSGLCYDLFNNICIDKDGGLPATKKTKDLSLRMSNMVRQAQDEGARALGHKGVESAIKEALQKIGLELKEDIDDYKLSQLLGGDMSYIGTPHIFFKQSENCIATSKEIKDFDASEEKNPLNLKKQAVKVKKFKQHYLQLIKTSLSNNLPGFYEVFINKCKNVNEAAKGMKQEKSSVVKNNLWKICQRPSQMKSKIQLIFKQENELTHPYLAGQFIEKYYNYLAEDYPPNESNKDSEDNTAGFCFRLDDAIQGSAINIIYKTLKKINSTKPTIEALTSLIYNKQSLKRADTLFNGAKEVLEKMIGKGGMGNKISKGDNMNKILQSYAAIRPFRPQPLNNSFFTKDPKTNVLLLDPHKMPSDDDFLLSFLDPSLSFFKELNAYYMPYIQYGEQVTHSSIVMLPSFLVLAEDNPFAYLEVVAHELGHNIGPQIARDNGFNLKETYEDLLSCYKSGDSIRMSGDQHDEVISDYISSEVLVWYIGQLPKEKQKDATIQSLQATCMFEATDLIAGHDALYLDGTHPTGYLRLNGIYGANPKLRSLLGCEQPSPLFKNCKLGTGMSAALEDKQ